MLSIAPILRSSFPFFSLSSPQPWRRPELSALPTATAVAINSPSTPTGHGNPGYGIITSPASPTSANSPSGPAASSPTTPSFDSLRLGLSANATGSMRGPTIRHHHYARARRRTVPVLPGLRWQAGLLGTDRHRAVLLARQEMIRTGLMRPSSASPRCCARARRQPRKRQQIIRPRPPALLHTSPASPQTRPNPAAAATSFARPAMRPASGPKLARARWSCRCRHATARPLHPQ